MGKHGVRNQIGCTAMPDSEGVERDTPPRRAVSTAAAPSENQMVLGHREGKCSRNCSAGLDAWQEQGWGEKTIFPGPYPVGALAASIRKEAKARDPGGRVSSRRVKEKKGGQTLSANSGVHEGATRRALQHKTPGLVWRVDSGAQQLGQQVYRRAGRSRAGGSLSRVWVTPAAFSLQVCRASFASVRQLGRAAGALLAGDDVPREGSTAMSRCSGFWGERGRADPAPPSATPLIKAASRACHFWVQRGRPLLNHPSGNHAVCLAPLWTDPARLMYPLHPTR
ncbi:hypothetical protein PSPO01_07611 [Paraphaeosphaeria sporulosa]